ncbi:MAG: S49 family peptidase [Chloroflexota bacterium]
MTQSDLSFAYRLVMQQPWAITKPALEALVEMAQARIAGSLRADFGDASTTPGAVGAPSGGVGVIPIRGTIKQHDASSFFDLLFGGTSADGISRQLKAFVADPAVRAIVLDIDSGGGTTYGMTELANEIMAARGRKPIIAVANSVAASAAFWLGSAADAFYASPGALVGSIGVYILHLDMSQAAEQAGVKPTFITAGKNKARGNEFSSLSDADFTHIQSLVNEPYEQFVADVARGRGVTPAAVAGGYGEGDVVTARAAKKLGMIDGVMTLDAAIAKAQTIRTKAPAGLAAESIDIEPQARDEEADRRLRLLRWQEQYALAGAVKGGPSGYSG